MNCVNIGESFPKSTWMQTSASIQPRKSPVKSEMHMREIPVPKNHVPVPRYFSYRCTSAKNTVRPKLRSLHSVNNSMTILSSRCTEKQSRKHQNITPLDRCIWSVQSLRFPGSPRTTLACALFSSSRPIVVSANYASRGPRRSLPETFRHWKLRIHTRAR